MLLLKNAHFKLHGQRYCLIRDEPRINTAYIIALDERNAMPKPISLNVLYENALPLDYSSNQEQQARRSQVASQAQIKRRDAAWCLIQPLVEDSAIFDKKARWSLISKRAKESGSSPVTILKQLRRYWQCGQSLDALLANFDNCGKFDREEHNISGRPSIKPGRSNFIVRKKDQDHFRDIIGRLYLKDERMTLADALQRLYENHYSYTDGNGKIFIASPSERPTRRQFEHFFHKNYTLEQTLRARRGAKVFEKDHRAILGTVAQQCRGVGHIFEIDATIADVTVVSSLNPSDIIGRPTLYYVIDRHSRLIVGWYAGLESPSWSAALQAIFSIAQDKQVLCQRLGIEYDPADWPAHGVMPENLYADRGEAMSYEAQRLCSSLATTVVNLPSCRPDWKPLVEGRFKLIHQSIADSVPGYNPASNATKRRATDFSLDACLTIENFEAIIVKSIIIHNRSIMPSYELNRQQLADHTRPSPINLWNHGIVSRTGQVTQYSENALRLALLPEAKGSVSGYGIKANGCYYMPIDQSKNGWFVEGRKRRLSVRVTYDRRRADFVYVHDKESPGGFFVAKLTPKSEKYQGKSLDEVKQLQSLEESLKSSAFDERTQLRAELHRFTDPLVADAQHKAKAARRGTSKTGRRKNIVEAREVERDFERDNSTHLVDTHIATPSPSEFAQQPLKKEPTDDSTRDNVVHLPSNANTSTVPTPTKLSLKDIARQARARLGNKAIGIQP